MKIGMILAVYMDLNSSSDTNTGILTEEMSKSGSDLRTDKSIFQVISNYKVEVSIFLDSISLIIMSKDRLIKELFNKKNDQKRIRIITEINKDNIQSCKELMKFGIELRHLDEVVGIFSINEFEYCATKKFPIQDRQDSFENQYQLSNNIVYSNDKEIVNHYKYIFEILWSKAIPAEQRTREVEDDINRFSTEILKNPHEISDDIIRLTENSSNISLCFAVQGPQLTDSKFFDLYSRALQKHEKEGNDDKNSISSKNATRWITTIDKKDEIPLIKILLGLGMQIRHSRFLTPMSFIIGDREIVASIEKMIFDKAINSALYSNEPPYIEHFKRVFEDLWKNSVDAVERIKDIEEPIGAGETEIIYRPLKTQELFINLIKSAKKEVLIIFPTVNAFYREVGIGIIQLLRQAAEERDINIRIITPTTDIIERLISTMIQSEYKENFDIERTIPTASTNTVTTVVVDRNESLVIEQKDDSKMNFADAIGLSTYSNSKPTVSSYIAIFENFWNQIKQYDELKLRDDMQNEFINIASHEMKTPTQAILGYTELLQYHPERREEMIQAIQRNVIRLQKLTSDILDVARIENRTLKLNKEKFDINKKISNVIKDAEKQISDSNKLKILFTEPSEAIFVEADKIRMYQVIANLLNNAIKFTKEGTISVSAKVTQKKGMNREGKEEGRDYGGSGSSSRHAIVSVKDSGAGIDPEILPRLFTKFATKSDKGTGLGLFISKSIIEAHDGKIWAENNPDGKGAMFAFSLPLSTNQP
ncbi:MAG TPA: HAMP domain-containing sensor histidine kinase [Nitrososphaeraceae archaeon]|nr:HAMP domain-containing sensor histidine kinase [Nitrososphaeraceae archaeon]